MPTLLSLRPRVRRAAALLLALGLAPAVIGAPVLVTVVDLTSFLRNPRSGLTLGPDGTLYGTTFSGAGFNNGAIFSVGASGNVTVSVQFTNNGTVNRGGGPIGGLLLATDGYFYGTTSGGGAANLGTVFRVPPGGGIIATLAEFTGTSGATLGSGPRNTLTEGAGGTLYGTTTRGGAADAGTIFRIAPDGTFSTLVEFTGESGANPGGLPYCTLALGADGNFYGSAAGVYAANLGILFRMTPAGALTTLLGFTDNGKANRGVGPLGGLALGRDGAFYGTTQGGASGYGTVFSFAPATNPTAVSTLAEFTGTSGAQPGYLANGDLVQGTSGKFFGTTFQGGASDKGTVFRAGPGDGLGTLVEFTGTSGPARGTYPWAGLTRAADGTLYGTTYAGGVNNFGTVFRLHFEPDGTPTQLASVSVEPGTGVRVRWQSLPGQASRVEYSDDLGTTWQAVAGTVTGNGAGQAEYLDATQPTPAKRFYRLNTPQ